jgi:hypothetical protein
MKRKLLYTLLFSTVILVGCASGGGGSGAGSPSPSPSPGGGTPSGGGSGGGGGGSGGGGTSYPVPFYTPVKVGTVSPYSSNSTVNPITYPYAADLTNTGADNVIIAGRESQPFTSTNHVNNVISVFGWENGTLVDQTSKWFSPGDNIITGSEPSLKFADFNKSGFKDMFVAPSTDSTVYGSPIVYFNNNGSNFTKYTLPTPFPIWSHDSTVYDLAKNGYPDIIATDYGPNFSVFVNNGNRTFTQVVQDRSNIALSSSSSVAVADFLNNGTSTMITTDSCGYSGGQLCTNSHFGTILWNWSITNNTLNLTKINELPTPIFEQPQWASYNFGGPTTPASHNIRVVAYDFIGNGIMDAIVISRPNYTNGMWPDMSAIQFLQNDGHGNFTDVTNNILVGYNYNTPASYNPRFIDLFGNGLTDIVLSAQDFNGNPSTQILLKTADGKYVSAFQNILTSFDSQAAALQNVTNNTNTVNIIKGPNNSLYFITTVNYQDSGTTKQAVYMSLIGNSSTNLVSASQLISSIKAQWPWMSDASANAVLSKTATNYFGIGEILNPDSVLNPVGSLGLYTSKGLTPITGYIAGLNMGDGQVTAFDQLGRNFSINMGMTRVNNYSNSFNMDSEHIDQYDLTSHTEYLINGPVNNYGPIRVGSETRNIGNTLNMLDPNLGPVIGSQPRNYTFGVPQLWTKGNWSAGAQYTTLNYNPWMAFGGSWGQITQTGNLDTTIRYNNNGFTAVAGSVYTTTSLTPGLITNVAPIMGVWGEAGYRYQDLGLYAGVKPVIVSGNAQANLPTSVDNNGNTVYTKKTLSIQNQAAGYVRALWNTDIQKNVNYRISGTAMTNGQYRLMNEIRFFFN